MITFWRPTVVTFCGFLLLVVGASSAHDDPSLFRVQDHDKWGFIDVTGKTVVPPTYEDCYSQFSEGLVPVKVGRNWGYANSAGTMVIQPRFDSAYGFRDGIAPVYVRQSDESEGKWGYIDKSGRFVLDPSDRFSYGGFDCGLMPVKVGEKWAYVDRKGA